ncbi:MAG: ribonuclease H family protein [Anaeroplasmataceae bacterium]|nr:ribonuclease H family protein [Anaeroplasmataceae bacterium]
MKYYAVKTEEESKIFTSWEDCKNYITGKKGFLHKSFLSLEEANAFLRNQSIEIDDKIPTAYIDGSFDSASEAYSFGCVFLHHGIKEEYARRFDKDKFSAARNVAGEIKGAGFIIQHACRIGIKELNICYDYEGIEKWYTGKWKANSEIALAYVAFKEEVKNKIKIHFHKIKSHSNNLYNDKADQLAKKALGLL